jgi:amidase
MANAAAAQPAFHDGRSGDLRTGAAYTADQTLAGFGALWLAKPGQPIQLFQAAAFQETRSGVEGAPTQFGPLSITRHVKRLDADTIRFADDLLNYTDDPVKADLVWGGAFFNRRGGLAETSHFQSQASDDGYVVFSVRERDGKASAVAAIIADAKTGALVDPSSANGTAPYPGSDPTLVGVRRELSLRPGERTAIVQFVLLRRRGETEDAFWPRVKAMAIAPDTTGLPPRLTQRAFNRRAARAPAPVFDDVSASIREIGAALADGRISVRELAERRLARISAYDQVAGGFNAFLRLSPDVLTQADQADARLARGEPVRPLEGVMLAVKDSINVAGLPTSLGLPALSDAIASHDATIVARMRAAGAIVLGKTNLDELIVGGAGQSTLGGQTLNAFDRRRSPGGSSGGSAVAVATGMATLALGTDTCDSLSNPAGLSGLVTLRGTQGSVPSEGVLPSQIERDIAGVLARTVDDLERAQNVITSLRPAVGRRAGVATLDSEFVGFPGQTAAGDAVRSALAASGLIVGDTARDWRPEYRGLRRPDSRAAIDTYIADLTQGRIANRQMLLELSGERLRPASRKLLGPPDPVAMSDADLEKAIHTLRTAIVQVLDETDSAALAYPANLVGASLVGTDRYPDSTCALSSHTGFPQLTVPAGVIASGSTSAGVSLLGRPDSEEDLFAIGRKIEAHVGVRPRLDLPGVDFQSAGGRAR